MKTCPKCGANYTAYIDFCFEDGGVLTLADTAGFGADDPTELDVPSPGNLPTSKRGPEITEEATQIAELQFTPAPSPPVRNSVGYTGGETPRAPEIQVLEEAPPPPSSTPEPEPVRTPERVPPKATPAEDFPTDTHERGSQRKVGLLLAAVGGLTAVVLVGVGVRRVRPR